MLAGWAKLLRELGSGDRCSMEFMLDWNDSGLTDADRGWCLQNCLWC